MGVMAMKGYSTFPKAPASLKPYYLIVKCYIQDNFGVRVLLLYRGAVSVFYSPSRLGNSSKYLSKEISMVIYKKKSNVGLPFATQAYRMLVLIFLENFLQNYFSLFKAVSIYNFSNDSFLYFLHMVLKHVKGNIENQTFRLWRNVVGKHCPIIILIWGITIPHYFSSSFYMCIYIYIYIYI